MPTARRRARAFLIWAALAAVLLVPLVAAVASPLLQWRQPVYIAAGFAGIIAMSLLLLQPLLAGGYLPDLAGPRGRRIHRWTGGLLVAVVIVHVAGLWITSPPDVIDALSFRSPTPFSVWGVIAMWAVFAAAMLAIFRRRLRPRVWRRAHTGLALLIITGSVVHALLIEGTMETLSKAGLCLLAAAATVIVAADLGGWARRQRPRPTDPSERGQ
ncbi:ferric reductase-like transmembrane domain-containing protein [Labrenzia sp. OB1]|uniref:ferric reductase-like transmembrane domain-containing protein n=1 Tax=Labrenzia sp. OB1 TaxID=1561204 RepID=UPI0007B26FE2|nr:ferric reductase-like transmembrane domain-containing protein [Labrenzia sp. OB1]KZM50131.1 ferric reductase [Labrenzia sp. OB1]